MTMQAESFWVCPRCDTRNKRYAAVCFGCGGDTKAAALRAARTPAADRGRTPLGARVAVAAGLVGAALLGFFLVRTFRSPALESAAASAEEPGAVVGREPLPPDATMPGAPDAGWAASVPSAPPAPDLPPRVAPATVAPAPDTHPRSYTNADLQAIVARRGAAATHDRAYLLALRQRRVDELRARLDRADSAEERAKLREWLDSALSDLQRARE